MRSIAALRVLAMIWTTGLLTFAARDERSTPAAEPAVADGAVALTGAGSRERIAAAKEAWRAGDWEAGRFQLPPGDDQEFIPLPTNRD